MTEKKKTIWIRQLGFGLILALGILTMRQTASAESELDNIYVYASYPEWEDGTAHIPEFSAPRGCDIEWEWNSPEASYGPGDYARGRITLTAEDGYEFSRSAKVTVGGAEVTGKTVSGSEMVLRIKSGPLQYKLKAPEHVSWSSEKSSVVKWSKVEHATGYRVRVYQDDKKVKEEIIKARNYDAGRYFNGDGDIYVSVTAVAHEGKNSRYIRESEERYVDGEDVDWDDRETTYGVWQGNRYRISGEDEPAVYAKGWIEIFGSWYYFDQNGTLKTGWIQDGGRTYYAASDGVMKTGWIKPQEGGPWYFLWPSGEMATGWVSAEPGTWYYLNPDGTMKVGWHTEGQQRYFLGVDGKMLLGWQKINESWYYFHGDGRMAVSETIGDYHVNADGVWV